CSLTLLPLDRNRITASASAAGILLLPASRTSRSRAIRHHCHFFFAAVSLAQCKTVASPDVGVYKARGSIQVPRLDRRGVSFKDSFMPPFRSRTTTHGRNMAGARGLWRATGMKDGDFGKPIIAVVNS